MPFRLLKPTPSHNGMAKGACFAMIAFFIHFLSIPRCKALFGVANCRGEPGGKRYAKHSRALRLPARTRVVQGRGMTPLSSKLSEETANASMRPLQNRSQSQVRLRRCRFGQHRLACDENTSLEPAHAQPFTKDPRHRFSPSTFLCRNVSSESLAQYCRGNISTHPPKRDGMRRSGEGGRPRQRPTNLTSVCASPRRSETKGAKNRRRGGAWSRSSHTP